MWRPVYFYFQFKLCCFVEWGKAKIFHEILFNEMAFAAPNFSITSDGEHLCSNFEPTFFLPFPKTRCEQRAVGKCCADRRWNEVFVSAIPFTLCIKRQVIKKDSNVTAQRMGNGRNAIVLSCLNAKCTHSKKKMKLIHASCLLCVIAQSLTQNVNGAD